MFRLSYTWRALGAFVLLLVLFRGISSKSTGHEALRDGLGIQEQLEELRKEDAAAPQPSIALPQLQCEQTQGAALSRLTPPSKETLNKAKERHPKHYPPWDAYKKRDFDPNRWQFLPKNQRYYDATVGGDSPFKNALHKPYAPNVVNEGVSCMGPRGKRYNESTEDLIKAYGMFSHGRPEALVGSYEAVGLDEKACFDRFSRYAPYGLVPGEMRPDGSAANDNVDWNAVSWGLLQQKCRWENAARFGPPTDREPIGGNDNSEGSVLPQKRTAVLLRTWDSYRYTQNDLQNIRALVTELALWSRAEYEVFLFVNVKNRSLPIFTNDEVYRQVVEASVPREFRDMAVLWTEEICEAMYPKVGNNEVYYQQFQPLQWFASQRPEFTHFWNWEMDARYIGHHYHFLNTIGAFAARQPRKYLWERSSRFFIPSLHQTWRDFSAHVASVVPTALSVWGPLAALETILGAAIIPYTVAADDRNEFGVGEDADLITLLPFFNPQDTLWVVKDKMWHFAQGRTTPRRAFINTSARFSRRLLEVMDLENTEGRSMASEMWPATVCLHYGLKAVYAPHPIFTGHDWPADYANEVFNPGLNVAPGTGPDAVYSPDRQQNFGGFGWYFWSWFPGTLYRRFLGWTVTDEDGDSVELDKHGRMCLPAMLLHPVKHVSPEDIGNWNPTN